MKTCKHCGETKEPEAFYADAASRDGRRPECKSCTAARRKAWYQLNRGREIARVQAWQRSNPERRREAQRRRRQDPEVKRRERDAYLRRRFGITVVQYDQLLAAQGGVCSLCRRPPTSGISLHVDHDHVSGATRGLLCFRCNNALGDLDDDPDRLRAAIEYLASHDPEIVAMTRAARERVRALRR